MPEGEVPFFTDEARVPVTGISVPQLFGSGEWLFERQK
jgi:hypothetical protein